MKAKKNAGIRSTWVPSLFVEQLASDMADFASEKPHVQAAVACIVWASASKYRAHTQYDGFMSFHFTELAALFDQRFDEINGRLAFCEVAEKWRFGSSCMAGEGFTKGYKLALRFRDSLDKFLNNRQPRVTRLMDSSGAKCGSPPRPIGSHDMLGVTTDRWGEAHRAETLCKVPVRLGVLRFVLLAINQAMAGCKLSMRRRAVTADERTMDHLKGLRHSVQKFIVLAQTDVGGDGHLLQQYWESPSGRLYGLGEANLQNASKLVRKAALAGSWDYDIANCHFAIAAQMAAIAGLRCPALENYIVNKTVIR